MTNYEIEQRIRQIERSLQCKQSCSSSGRFAARSIDYSTLLKQYQEAKLSPGWYLIEDYQTICKVQFTDSSHDGSGGDEILNTEIGNWTPLVEPLYIRAITEDTFDPNVVSALYPSHSILYDIDNSIAEYYEYDGINHKGVIYHRLSPKGQHRQYDFMSVVFRRWVDSLGRYVEVKPTVDVNDYQDYLCNFVGAEITVEQCFSSSAQSEFNTQYGLDNTVIQAKGLVVFNLEIAANATTGTYSFSGYFSDQLRLLVQYNPTDFTCYVPGVATVSSIDVVNKTITFATAPTTSDYNSYCVIRGTDAANGSTIQYAYGNTFGGSFNEIHSEFIHNTIVYGETGAVHAVRVGGIRVQSLARLIGAGRVSNSFFGNPLCTAGTVANLSAFVFLDNFFLGDGDFTDNIFQKAANLTVDDNNSITHSTWHTLETILFNGNVASHEFNNSVANKTIANVADLSDPTKETSSFIDLNDGKHYLVEFVGGVLSQGTVITN